MLLAIVVTAACAPQHMSTRTARTHRGLAAVAAGVGLDVDALARPRHVEVAESDVPDAIDVDVGRNGPDAGAKALNMWGERNKKEGEEEDTGCRKLQKETNSQQQRLPHVARGAQRFDNHAPGPDLDPSTNSIVLFLRFLLLTHLSAQGSLSACSPSTTKMGRSLRRYCRA